MAERLRLFGTTGLYDELNGKWWLDVKFSMWATQEENRKLLEQLKPFVEDYLEAVANRNNGRF